MLNYSVAELRINALVLLKEINTKSISYNNCKDKMFFLK